MQTIYTNIKCCEIMLSVANENWYVILYDLFSRLWYIATCGPFCKDATHIMYINIRDLKHLLHNYNVYQMITHECH